MYLSQEKRTFPHIDHKKEDIQIFTGLLNRSPSQCFFASSSLKFVGMKFRVRHSVGMVFTEVF